MTPKWDLAKVGFYCATVVLIFAYGVAVGKYELFPYGVIKFGQDSLAATFEERENLLGIRASHLIEEARYDGDGVTQLRQGASPGLTLIVSVFEDSNEMRLLRLDGSIVSRWPVSFSTVFPEPTHIIPETKIPQTDWNTHAHGALALPTGSVIFNFEQLGLVKLDRCGAVEWALPRMTHHSVEVSEGGGFWVAGGRWQAEVSPLPPIPPPFQEETILKVSENGEVQSEISLLDLFSKNDMLGLLFVRMLGGQTIPNDDMTHLNDVEELSSEMAKHFPEFAPGDLLLSLREMNMILIVDPATEEVKWHQTGPWIAQHDPDFQSSGRISVFSNNMDGTDDGSISGGSTILEVDPASRTTTVKYGGSAAQRMFTANRGKHQYLENGNLLVTESLGGRIFEVDSDGDIVWEFINRYDEDEVAIVTQATRYPENYFDVSDWSCPE